MKTCCHDALASTRITSFLDDSQSPDQAGFRKGYGCDDNLFTVVQIIERLAECQLPLWMCAIDFRKAFDTVEHFAIWEALLKQGVPVEYVVVMRSLYEAQVGTITTPVHSKEFKIERGTKQGGPMSPRVFNAVLENAFKEIQATWRRIL